MVLVGDFVPSRRMYKPAYLAKLLRKYIHNITVHLLRILVLVLCARQSSPTLNVCNPNYYCEFQQSAAN